MAVFYYPLCEPMQHKCAQLLSSLAYQRDRLGSRRGSRGLASLTVRARPSSSLPLSPWMAALAAALSGISTKPKPLERPVSRSVMTLILSTTPYGSKSWRRLSSVALNARLPTKIFTYNPLHREKQRNDRQVIRTVCRSTRPEQSVGETAKRAWRTPVC